jgi:hypothetical protein
VAYIFPKKQTYYDITIFLQFSIYKITRILLENWRDSLVKTSAQRYDKQPTTEEREKQKTSRSFPAKKTKTKKKQYKTEEAR